MLDLKRSPRILVLLTVVLVAAVLAQPARGLAMPMPGDGPPTAMDVSSNTGDATLRIPIPVPPGTRSFEPELALRYSSSSGDGPFGAGWALEFGEIQRSIRFGTPSFNDTLDRFEVDGQLLVVNPADSNTTQTRYHTATEGFVRIYHYVAPFIDWWEVTQPDGTKLKFGFSEASRVRKDETGPIFRWLLEELVDPYGNTIKFTHFMQGGEAYPQRAQYTFRNGSPVGTLRTVEFIYQNRPDPSLTFMGGVRREVALRADRIEVKTGSTVFRKLEMTYAGEPGSGKSYLTGRSRLASVQIFGVGGTDALPPQKLEYRDAADDPAHQGAGGHWTPQSFPLPAGVDPSKGLRVAELNGDGYPDLIVAYTGASEGTTRSVYLGSGNGWSTTPDTAWSNALSGVTGTKGILTVFGVSTSSGPRPCLPGGGTPTVLDAAQGVLFGQTIIPPESQSVPTGLVGIPTSLAPQWLAVDVNGDGRDDLLQSQHTAEMVFEYNCGSSTPLAPVYVAGGTRRDVWLNTGTGFARDTTLSNTLPPFAVLVINGRIKRYDLDPRFTDLDGDGRLDLIVMGFTVQNGGVKRVYDARTYRNTPGGWIAMTGLNPPTAQRLLDGDDRLTPTAYRGVDRSVEFVDINRDGLADTIKTAIENAGSCTGAEFSQSGVWLNAGNGWCDGNTGGACSGATAQYLPPAPFQKLRMDGATCLSQSAGVTFTDLNGDGFQDLLRTDGTTVSGQPISGGKRAWIHMRAASGVSVWQQRDQFTPPLATVAGTTLTGTVTQTGVLLTDADVDGAFDLVDFSSAGASSVVGRLRFADLLSRVENGRGGIADYTYESAAKQQNPFLNAAADQALGVFDGDLNWSTRPVLSSRSLGGVDVQPVAIEYLYAQPRFFVSDRMRLGFALVSTTVAGTRSQSVVFYQTLGISGLRKQVDIAGISSAELRRRLVFQREVSMGNDPTVGDGSTAAARVGRITSQTAQNFYGTFPGLTTGALQTQTFEYGPKNGHPFSGYGFVTRMTTTRPTGTLVETNRMRAPDTARWIVGLPEDTLVTSGSSELARTSLIYSNEGSPTTIAEFEGPRGNLSSATPRNTTLVYDVFGNVRSSTDPANRVTRFCYDGDATFLQGGSCNSPTVESSHSVLVAVLDPLVQVTTFRPDAITSQIVETLRMYSGDRDKEEFDAFGRSKRTMFQPSGGSEIVLLEIDYFDLNEDADPDPGADQEHIVGRFRVQAGSASEVRFATYLDGFGQAVRQVDEGPRESGQARYFGVATRSVASASQTISKYPANCATNKHCTGLFEGSQPEVVETREALGRVSRIQDPDGVSQVEYRSEVRTHPDTGAHSFDAVLAMDGRGFLTQRILDGGRVVWAEECSNSALADPPNADLAGISCQSPKVTFYRYEPTGEIKEVYDALTTSYGNSANAVLRFVYDSFGRVVQTFDLNKTAPTLTMYHAAGGVQKETNARGQVVTFEPDELNRVKTITYPGGSGVTSEQYVITYDNRTRQPSQIKQTSTGAGTTIVSVQDILYDVLGRRSIETLKYLQSPTLIAEFDLDLLGRPTEIRYPDLSTEVAYEYEGAFLKRVCELGPATNCGASGALPYISDAQYDSIGREVEVAGSTSADPNFPAPKHIFHYSATTHRLDQLRVDTGWVPVGGETLHQSYTYDEVGNVLGVTDLSIVLGQDDVSFAANFTYDARNRISSRQRGGVSRHFTYDAVGNLTGKLVNAPNETNQSYDTTRRHRVTNSQGVAYSYDADGNVVQRGSQELSYDGLSRLVCVGSQGLSCDSFAYGPEGFRIAGGGQVTPLRVFVGDFFEWEVASGDATARIYALGRQVAYKKIQNSTLRSGISLQGVPVERFIPLLVTLLAACGATVFVIILWRGGLHQGLAKRPVYGVWAVVLVVVIVVPPPAGAGFTLPPGQGTYRRWVWEDTLGSSVHVTDGTGFATHQRAFEPFGEVADERMSTEPTPDTFAGNEIEASLGLHYVMARWYDPTAGRFISPDPLVRNLFEPQSINSYSYVENRPTTLTDPTGLCAAELFQCTSSSSIAGGEAPAGLPAILAGGRVLSLSSYDYKEPKTSVLGSILGKVKDFLRSLGGGGLALDELVRSVGKEVGPGLPKAIDPLIAKKNYQRALSDILRELRNGNLGPSIGLSGKDILPEGFDTIEFVLQETVLGPDGQPVLGQADVALREYESAPGNVRIVAVRPVIRVSYLGAATLEAAYDTIGHELRHLTAQNAGLSREPPPGSNDVRLSPQEIDADAAGRRVREYFAK